MKKLKKITYSIFILFIALLVSGSLLCFSAIGANASMKSMAMAKYDSSAFAMQHSPVKSSVPECCINRGNNEKANIGSNFDFQEKIIVSNADNINPDSLSNNENNILVSLSDTSPPGRESLSSVIKIE
ncbi:MAG: hypothetical protein V1804_01605 [Patescibacteria group bacterium]